jgi:alanine racemase
MVRPGIALFGYGQAPDVDLGLTPALRLRTEVIALRDLPAGARVGYNGTFRTERPARVATLPVGYGDGLMRAHSNRGHVLVGGQRAPIIGAVSMDLTTVDVTDIPGVALGDEVVLLGSQGTAELGADELAAAAGTIPYEVLTNVSRRVPRFCRS